LPQKPCSGSTEAPGSLLTKKHTSYVDDLLFDRPVLQSVSVDQDEDAFMEEMDDGFRCVPDHRLGILNHPVPSEGYVIVGIVGFSVSELTAKVVQGGRAQSLHFNLREKWRKNSEAAIAE
jgi:hypothetical protein